MHSKSRIFLTLLSFTITLSSNIFAQDSSQTHLNLSSVDFETCSHSVEVCGNGLDENCDGVDTPCSGADKDRDGYASSVDCDDNNRFIYPGISIACDGPCDSPHKKCQNNGTYTSCSCSSLCEAASGGRCYYIDPVKGTDNGNGNFTNRIKSIHSLITKSVLKSGDFVYLFSGIYEQESELAKNNSLLEIRNLQVAGGGLVTFKNYPGAIPVFTSKTPKLGLLIQNSRGLLFEGITIEGTTSHSISLTQSRDITFRNIIIRRNLLANEISSTIKINNSSAITFDNSIVHSPHNMNKFLTTSASIQSVGSSGIYFIRSNITP